MRSVLFSLGLTFAVTLPCQAQEAKPNTLTPKEIADGWILLFDGETTFGWEVDGDISVVNGAIKLGGTKNSAIRLTSPFGGQVEQQYDYEFDAGQKNAKAYLRYNFSGGFSTDPLKPGKEHVASDVLCPDPFNLGFEVANGATMTLRNIKFRPRQTKSLFNGKDLTGWKVFPGDKYKSKFTVTDKGELNVKDGPGDLQTTGKYRNFILQLECISLGKHLNSGIFFRCRDNEYQNGYEAQIRNQFTAEATQDYVIEVYDPKTNKLVEKKKIKSTAVDYGTGAIYRRQPARKEIAKDGEWFSMTIVASGNHLATWVNGVQVTDWTDNRPLSDNARTGRKLEAGHISIQGHDPTTNLSFRNLRIAELPAVK